MALNSDDPIRKATGVKARDVESVANLGANLPGFAGNAIEFAGVAAGTVAEGTEVATGMDYLARRLRMSKAKLLTQSRMLSDDNMNFESGSKLTRRLGSAGTRMAASAGGAAIGGALGSVVPVAGTTIGALAGGAIAGTVVGGAASDFLFPEGGANNVDILCDLCNKQEQRALKAEDILQLVGRKARPREQETIEKSVARGNRNGFGLDRRIIEAYVAPVLGDSYFVKGDKTACEYIADQCNSGRLDVAQLGLDVLHMKRRPPSAETLAAMGLEADQRATPGVMYDASYAGGRVSQPQVPMGAGRRGRGPGEPSGGGMPA